MTGFLEQSLSTRGGPLLFTNAHLVYGITRHSSRSGGESPARNRAPDRRLSRLTSRFSRRARSAELSPMTCASSAGRWFRRVHARLATDYSLGPTYRARTPPQTMGSAGGWALLVRGGWAPSLVCS